MIYLIRYQVRFTLIFHVATAVKRPVVSLELQLDLFERPNQSLKISEIVELENTTNTVVEFKWNPVNSGRGISFSMRPASGSILPNSTLFCEMSFHPSFTAPTTGEFELQVDGNSKLQSLVCEVDLGTSNVQFNDRRINFGTIPLNIGNWD